MIKQIWKKIKTFFKKFKIYLIGEQPTKEEIFNAIFDYVLKNEPHVMSEHCLCGSVLSIHDVEKHYARDYVHILYYCKKCNCTTEFRYSYNMELLKD